jgi:type II restriction enzyme
MKRKFDDIMESLKTSIAGYDYYVDFKKVYENVDDILIPLNLLNSLLGTKESFDGSFLRLIHKYPEALKALPILLAVRTGPKYVINVFDKTLISFCFSKVQNTDVEYLTFMDKTGLKDLIANGKVTNLVDYVTGVEVGLDSNARKNRGGTAMENLVYSYLKATFGDEVLEQANKEEIEKKYGYDDLKTLNLHEGKNQADKRFDFAFKYDEMVYLVETNFYASSGSKLNEVARSYERLADEINRLEHFRFVWITDGKGWKDAKNNLRESYEHQEYLFTIQDLENNLLLKEIEDYVKENKKD